MEKSGAERLSFTSECFDPNLALKSAKAIPTPLKSKIFSNLNKYVDSLRQSASFKSLGWLPKGIVEESGNRSTEIAQLKKKSECKGIKNICFHLVYILLGPYFEWLQVCSWKWCKGNRNMQFL